MDHEMTPTESLKLIEETIRQAKRSFHRQSYYFLLWGVLLTLATLTEYAFASQGSPYGPWAWAVAGVVGGILSSVHGSKEGRERPVRTAMDRVFLGIWVAFFFTLVLMLFGHIANERSPGPVVTVLTGLPTFATGWVLRFKPLLFGGVVFWVAGAISFFVPGLTGALIFAVAMVFGYIIPGYLLKRQEDAVRTA